MKSDAVQIAVKLPVRRPPKFAVNNQYSCRGRNFRNKYERVDQRVISMLMDANGHVGIAWLKADLHVLGSAGSRCDFAITIA